jgi:hypothetical protein
MIKGSLMKAILPVYFQVDLGTVMIAYVMISFGGIWAGVFAVGQGIMMDIFSASPLGLFPLLYLVGFLAIQGGCRFFDLYSARGQIILISAAVCLESMVLLLLLSSFAYNTGGSYSSLVFFGASAAATGLLAPLGFVVLDVLKKLVMKGAT